jgi:hypothetical protein
VTERPAGPERRLETRLIETFRHEEPFLHRFGFA